MTTLADFNKADLVDDVLAADFNELLATALRAEFANTETITATRELADSDTQFQILTPSGADRTVELAPETTSNHVTVIYNPVGTSYNLLVKDDSGSTTYALLDAGEWALCMPMGSVWKVQKMERYEVPASGGMINGKLSVTVSSNNLTVAIKTLAGNDPSAGDPVRVRINDTEHRITAALSVTKNAGTNWCNSGGAELATQEADYFVYLGYNATDGVVIGFSRVSYGTQYSSFSTTSTAETYCAISTITNAAAADPYTIVGRFAATLSAGAGYTWSVPTFTPTNLIQRPIHESRWLTWVPTLVGFSSDPTNAVYRYRVYSGNVSIQFRQGANGTSNDTTFTATLPFTAMTLTNATWNAVCAQTVDNNSLLTSPGMAIIGSASATVDMRKDTSGAIWTSSNGKRIAYYELTYRIA